MSRLNTHLPLPTAIAVLGLCVSLGGCSPSPDETAQVGPEAQALLQALAESLKSEAAGLLYACLSECEATHGAPQTMNGSGILLVPGVGPANEPFSIGRVHQRLVQKYRLYGELS